MKMIGLIAGGIAGFIILAVVIIIQQDKFHKLATKFDKLVETHNGFVDFVRDEFDYLYDETNDRIKGINHEFHNVYDVLNASKKFADEVTDTMELMCDTDEIVIDRLNDLEDDVYMMWDAVEEHDDILYSFFDEAPEQVEENIDDDKMVEGCCGKIGEDGEYEYFKKVEVTAKKKPEAKKRGRPKKSS